MKYILSLTLLCGVCLGQMPDAPQPQPSAKHVTFWTFRKSWQDPPLRSNKQMLTSKPFLLSTIGGAAAMIVACRNKRSGEDWHSEVPAVIGVDAIAFLSGKYFTQSYAVAPGAYQIVHYSIAATH
jgi:hypothetical protein